MPESMTGEQLKKIVYSRVIIKKVAANNAENYQKLSEHLQARETKLHKVRFFIVFFLILGKTSEFVES